MSNDTQIKDFIRNYHFEQGCLPTYKQVKEKFKVGDRKLKKLYSTLNKSEPEVTPNELERFIRLYAREHRKMPNKAQIKKHFGIKELPILPLPYEFSNDYDKFHMTEASKHLFYTKGKQPPYTIVHSAEQLATLFSLTIDKAQFVWDNYLQNKLLAENGMLVEQHQQFTTVNRKHSRIKAISMFKGKRDFFARYDK